MRMPQPEPVVREKVVTVVRDEPIAQPQVIHRIVHHTPRHHIHFVQSPEPSYASAPQAYVGQSSFQATESPSPAQTYQSVGQNQAFMPNSMASSSGYGSDAGVQQLTASQEFSPSMSGFLLRKVKL
ncbi:hypothetical protein L596_022757 [Steinernema carpocapsae]|nr:hypothetical protein L596_022757 [Steinernema carpocapsae]